MQNRDDGSCKLISGVFASWFGLYINGKDMAVRRLGKTVLCKQHVSDCTMKAALNQKQQYMNIKMNSN